MAKTETRIEAGPLPADGSPPEKLRVFHRKPNGDSWTHPYDERADCEVCPPDKEK